MLLATQVGDLFVDGRSSRKGYTEIFVAQFVTLSQVELPVAKTTQKIFQKFSFKCSGDWPWRLSRDLIQSQKSRVLCKNGQFLNLFSFPQTFFTVHLLPYLKHSQTNLYFCFISTPYLQKKGMGFLSLGSYFMF